MKKLREIFSRDEILQSSSPVFSKNYYFSPSTHPGLSGFKIVHQEVRLIENPVYLVRKYFLAKDIKNDIPVQITISLAWEGFDYALDFLFGFTESLELFFNPEKVINTQPYALGNFGVAWGWVSEELNVLVFIRNNVFVGIQGFLPEEEMLTMAKMIDVELKKAGTKNPYQDELQALPKKSATLKIPIGSRLDVGVQRPGAETFFFITTAGSMNRDINRPDLWFFRAGYEIGASNIVLFRVAEGILPKKETLPIEIISE